MDFSGRAADFTDSLPPKQFRQVIRKVFALLEEPLPHDSQALSGSHYRRADVGEYRIIYALEKDVLQVVIIGKRNDGEVYRDVKRL
ncbi:MAG: type II toxin-antitoxin system RelE/ParE family toxin [Nitrospinae bacterium]|nr:type II toxin-antitoxin system RelE/ParE family toxin [Nitrospinota bacterium]MBF0633035.1 type II toxin-antitoxin system RelE/ParE family toxin [Nitrospinota bacterium]